eukprot:scaffold1012_cov418-Prasinococcus_capsulatus_cf.AAC.5
MRSQRVLHKDCTICATLGNRIRLFLTGVRFGLASTSCIWCLRSAILAVSTDTGGSQLLNQLDMLLSEQVRLAKGRKVGRAAALACLALLQVLKVFEKESGYE